MTKTLRAAQVGLGQRADLLLEDGPGLCPVFCLPLGVKAGVLEDGSVGAYCFAGVRLRAGMSIAEERTFLDLPLTEMESL